MNYILSFLLCGIFCMISQIILDNSKMTPGHVTSLFTAIGVILSFFNVYDLLIKYCGAGALLLISNFGNALYKGAINGYLNNGFLGIFDGLLKYSSLALTSAIIFAYICTIFFKAKD